MGTGTERSRKTQRTIAAVLAIALIAMGAMVAPALAQSPGSGYDETGVMNNVPPVVNNAPPVVNNAPPGGGDVLGDEDSGAGTSPTSTSPTAKPPTPSAGTVPRNESGATPPAATGNLPFTGLDVGIVVLMSLALLGTGLLLRRSGRSQ